MKNVAGVQVAGLLQQDEKEFQRGEISIRPAKVVIAKSSALKPEIALIDLGTTLAAMNIGELDFFEKMRTGKHVEVDLKRSSLAVAREP